MIGDWAPSLALPPKGGREYRAPARVVSERRRSNGCYSRVSASVIVLRN